MSTNVKVFYTGRRYDVRINGGDNLAPHIIDGGLAIEFPSWPDQPLIHVTFRATTLTVALDDAQVREVAA